MTKSQKIIFITLEPVAFICTFLVYAFNSVFGLICFFPLLILFVWSLRIVRERTALAVSGLIVTVLTMLLFMAVALPSFWAYQERHKQQLPYLFDMLNKPKYHKAWNALFVGEASVDSWLAMYSKTKDGPADPGVAVTVNGLKYQINTVCKTHDCGDNQFFVLFAPQGTKAWGLLLRDRKDERFFGNPDDGKKKVLRAVAYE